MATFFFFFFLLGGVLLFQQQQLLPLAAAAHNITAILDTFPTYSLHNSYLTQTKLADEINRRQTITCLVLNNSAMSAIAAQHPLHLIKTALMIHVFLDYFDSQKLHQLSQPSILTTTLYQTTGLATGTTGFVNITLVSGSGNDAVFRSAAATSDFATSTLTKSVKQFPYDISVLEISAPIVVPGILEAPSIDILALLENAGCGKFAALLNSSGVIENYQAAMGNGLTVFAPSDGAFTAAGVPDLSKLTSQGMVLLLHYHASADYLPKGTLMITRNPIRTLASEAAGKLFHLTVTRDGDQVTIHTGLDSSRVADMVLDSTPVAIYKVDDLLLPEELFGEAPSLAPAPPPPPPPTADGPVVGPTPKPISPASPPGTVSEAPSSGPAADGPEAFSMGDIGGGHVTAACFFTLFIVVVQLSFSFAIV